LFKLFAPGDDDEKRRLRAEVNELKEAIVKDNKLLTSLSSVSGGTASKVKKALSETNTKPRWVQELTPEGKAVFVDRRTGMRHERLTRRELIADGAFLWAPFSEEENKRDRLHLQMQADKLKAETETLREQARGQEELSESLRQRLATAETQLRLRPPAPSAADDTAERERKREREREQSIRQALEAEIARHKEGVARTGRELEEAVKSGHDLRSTLDLNQRRHQETAEQLEQERARGVARDEELRTLREQLASQNQALLRQLEGVEKAAKSASRATVDLEVMSAVARAKAALQ